MTSAVLDKVRGHLDCPTCLDTFNNPVTLECGHSFCLKCLNDYVQAHPTAVTRQILPCSVCRHETTVPHPEESVEDWGKQLTPSFTIRKLAEEIKNSSSTNESGDNCFVCLGHGETTPGVLWCQECEISLCQRCSRTHQILPDTKDHEVFELKDKSKRKRPLKLMCPEHKELIKFHCKDCKKSVCSSCCTLRHRKCDDIVPIQSMLGEMESSIAESHRTVLDRLQDKNNELTLLKIQLESNDSKQDATLSKIDDLEKRTMTLLQEKYQKDKDEVRKAAGEEKSALQVAIKTAQLDIEMYRQHAEVLSQVLESRDETDIVKTQNFCQSGSLLAEDARDRDERDRVTDLDFRVREDNVQRLLSDLGQVEVTKTKAMLYRPRLVKKVDTETDDDDRSPGIHNILTLRVRDTDAFIVTDYRNNSVKCFYSRHNKPPSTSNSSLPGPLPIPPPSTSQSVCRLLKGPSGITKFGDNSVIVSIPHRCELVTLCVTPDLVKDTFIDTEKKYYSLCMLTSGLLAAVCYGSIDVLSVSGDTVTRVRSFADDLVFTSPRDLAINIHDSNIIVSDIKDDTVTCLTSEGGVNWTYKSPPGKSFRPRGVTTTRRGDVVVVDSCSKHIMILTCSGVHKSDILIPKDSEICDPMSIHCDDHDYLYVSESSGRVLIYKLTGI